MSTERKYKKRKKWEKEDMSAAIIAIREKKMGYLKASKHFNVPRSTLFRLVNEKDALIESVLNKVIGRRPVLGPDIENLLVEYILTMENKFYGLTRMDLRRLAYQLAMKNKISNPFKEGFAGRYWLKGFLKRNQQILSIRQPTGTSQARANGFTKERMDLESAQLKKSNDENRKREKASKKKAKKRIPKKRLKRNRTESESSGSNPDTNFGNSTDLSDDETVTSENTIPSDKDVECFFCNGKYSDDKRGEEWVQCLMCELWVHSACGGYETGVYICDYCKN